MTRHPLRLLSALVVVLALGATGCVHTFDATRLGVPATLAEPAGSTLAGTAFRVNSHATFVFWGLGRVSSPSLQKALASQLLGGKGVVGVRITVRSRWSDILFTGLTLGLIVPRTVTFEGVIVDRTAPAP